MLKGLFVLRASDYERIYGPAEQQAIRQFVDIYALPNVIKNALMAASRL